MQNDAAMAFQIVADHRNRGIRWAAADEETVAAEPAVELADDADAGGQHEEAIVTLGAIDDQLLDVDVTDIEASAEHAGIGDDEVVAEFRAYDPDGIEAV